MAPTPVSIQRVSDHVTSRESLSLSTIFRRATSTRLTKRQNIVAIPATYQIPLNNPSPGTVVGIVLGVVLGICFVLWVIYTVFNLNKDNGPSVEIIKTRPARKSRHSARSETIEVSRPRPRSLPRRTREVVVEEIRRAPVAPEDDIVEVIEEHSPVRRSRRSSGYRNVDPNEFGGGRRDRRGVR